MMRERLKGAPDVWYGRIGGGLMIGGLVLLAMAAVVGSPRVEAAPVLIPAVAVSAVVLASCLALVGAGALALGACASVPFNDRALRIGLRSVAFGLFSLSVVFYLSDSGTMKGPAVDALLVPLAGGALASIIGALVAGLAIAQKPSPARLVGVLLLGGLLLVVIGNWARGGTPPAPTAIAISAVGLIVVGLGGLGVGILGITRPRDRQQDRAHVTGSETY
jgi:hypothetical protein